MGRETEQGKIVRSEKQDGHDSSMYDRWVQGRERGKVAKAMSDWEKKGEQLPQAKIDKGSNEWWDNAKEELRTDVLKQEAQEREKVEQQGVDVLNHDEWRSRWDYVHKELWKK